MIIFRMSSNFQSLFTQHVHALDKLRKPHKNTPTQTKPRLPGRINYIWFTSMHIYHVRNMQLVHILLVHNISQFYRSLTSPEHSAQCRTKPWLTGITQREYTVVSVVTENVFPFLSGDTLLSSHIWMKEEGDALNIPNLTSPLALFKGRWLLLGLSASDPAKLSTDQRYGRFTNRMFKSGLHQRPE